MTDERANPSQLSNRDGIGDSHEHAEVFRALRNRRHRCVLDCLKTAETPMALADLADELARSESDVSPSAVRDVRERVYASLYHRHLPKLASDGLVDFDTDQNMVALSEDADDFLRGGDRPSTDERLRRSLTDDGSNDNRKRVKEKLVDALDAEACAEKERHIREALQLLNINER